MSKRVDIEKLVTPAQQLDPLTSKLEPAIETQIVSKYAPAVRFANLTQFTTKLQFRHE